MALVREWICTDARMSDAHKQWSKVKLVRKVLEKPTKSQSKSHRSKSEAKQVSFYCSSEDSNDIYFYIHASENDIEEQKRNFMI